MKKTANNVNDVNRLLGILHKYKVAYELTYKTGYSQPDGQVDLWTFTINSDRVIDALWELSVHE